MTLVCCYMVLAGRQHLLAQVPPNALETLRVVVATCFCIIGTQPNLWGPPKTMSWCFKVKGKKSPHQCLSPDP